jgi:hypothetical protein
MCEEAGVTWREVKEDFDELEEIEKLPETGILDKVVGAYCPCLGGIED